MNLEDIKLIINNMVSNNIKDVEKGIRFSLKDLRNTNLRLNQLRLTDDEIVVLYKSDVAETLLHLIESFKK